MHDSLEWPDVADPGPSWTAILAAGRPVWSEQRRAWIVAAPADVAEVCQDWRYFSNSVDFDRDRTFDFLLTVDPPQHSADRRVFVQAFQPAISRAVGSALDRLHLKTRSVPRDVVIDVVEELCVPIGLAFAAALLEDCCDPRHPISIGELETSIRGRFRSASDADGTAPLDAMAAQLLHDGLPHEVVVGKVVGLATAVYVAASDTLPAALALTLLASIQRPELLETFRNQPLQLDTPLLGLWRQCRNAKSVGGSQINSGDAVFLAFAAANAASSDGVGDDHSFGVGLHRCPAAHSVNVLAAELARWSLDDVALSLEPGRRCDFTRHTHLRRLKELPVTVRDR